MPNPRVYFDKDELVVSKTTKDASDPDLPDTDKIFDSKWLFGLQVLGEGVWTYPQETSTYRDFAFPDYGFQPALMIRTKTKPFYRDIAGARYYAQATDRPGTSVFSAGWIAYDRSGLVPAPKFINDTTVRIYRTDPYSAIEYHWMAMNL